ncbi:hypothetical protein COJ46_23015 [Bacillus sp. AFS077874]|uniref:aldo/keto reductase n=1 Tax=unclassified Bacillus (in: firmicutes) TaxID=185979 RepID=UPI000BEDE787|nr:MULTISPECIES: aldo/keto reductase [unclassified Bacillus (in: firmicutes)]PEC49031.1 hypothetical protein CON00_12255 [Bacillus sp. AFS096315]PFM74700.1 hypothetical protein COJ46_23015 [Bacillus sp. AFS077874]
MLTGNYNKHTDLSEKMRKRPQFREGVYEENLEKIEKVRKIASEKGSEIAHVVLAWYLTREAIDVIIPGAKREVQVLHNLKTLEVHLKNEEIQEIDRIFS